MRVRERLVGGGMAVWACKCATVSRRRVSHLPADLVPCCTFELAWSPLWLPPVPCLSGCRPVLSWGWYAPPDPSRQYLGGVSLGNSFRVYKDGKDWAALSQAVNVMAVVGRWSGPGG